MTQRDPDGASAHITRRRLLQLALATGALDADQRTVESMAEESVKESIRRAVLLAESVPGFPSIQEGGGA